MVRFEVLEDFYSEVLKSGYNKGMIYSIRPHAQELAKQVLDFWLPEGKVVLVDSSGLRSTVDGKATTAGEVKKLTLWERIKKFFKGVFSWR